MLKAECLSFMLAALLALLLPEMKKTNKTVRFKYHKADTHVYFGWTTLA